MSRKHPGQLSLKQEQALDALLSYPTVRDAAKSVGVTDKTLWTWLALPSFKQAYEEKRAAIAQEVRQGLVSLARSSLIGLQSLMDDANTPAAVRLKAFQLVLDRVVPIEASQGVPLQGNSPHIDLSGLNGEQLDLLQSWLAQSELKSIQQ